MSQRGSSAAPSSTSSTELTRPEDASWLGRVSAWLTPSRWTPAHWAVALLWVAAVLFIQWRLGTGFAAAANPDPTRNDQGAYLRMTADNLGYWWPTANDGIRNPLFPFLLKPWYSPDLQTFFHRAQLVNVWFGLLATAGIALFWLRRFPFLAGLNLTALTALVVTLPASSWVGAEAIFYLGFFFLWLLFAELLTRNPLKLYALAGLVAAFCYLAKPSITLLAGLFFAFSLLRAVQAWRTPTADDTWTPRRWLLGSVIFFAVLLVPTLPRAIYCAEKFGDPFQNTAQSCMWFDDWDTAYPQLSNLNPKHIDRLPADQRPTPANFFRRNSTAQVVERMKKGVDRQWHNFLLPEGDVAKGKKMQVPELRLPVRMRGAYLGALALFAIVLAVGNRGIPELPAHRTKRRAWLWLALGAFVLHFAAFSFYTPIAGGARFIMSLFLPVTAALAMAIETHREQCDATWRRWAYLGFQLLLAGLMLWHLGWLAGVKKFGEMRGAF